ncbi:PREDICTED: melatonin receptor type 1B-B-like [Branchiostoma belcheri]|uniref:Melatonin receptor type 1B-B-like n=1 Tax=Branchiostoma belcheri TaxID=7741 RepID=A0A6P4YUI4_BRABE|nr:PREDICTED: melatonin receptor type 1B-B-like [Branchiostoma belcheri]
MICFISAGPAYEGRLKMNATSISAGAGTNVSSITGDVYRNVSNVTELIITNPLNVTFDLAKNLTNDTAEEGVTRLLRAAQDAGLCEVVFSNLTSSGHVTTTVASYDPAACGVYGSNPALQPLLIVILVCITLWAIFGNSCLIGIILTDENMQEPGNIFLCALAFTDIAQSLMYSPNAIYSLVHGESPGGLWCRTQAFFVPFLSVLSTLLLLSLWICRYVHIVWPLEFHSMLTPARLAVAIVTCFLVALTPPLVGLARVGKIVTWSVDIASVDIAEPASLLMPCTFGGPESLAAVMLCLLGVVASCCFASLIYKVARSKQQSDSTKEAWLAQADMFEVKVKAVKTLGIVVLLQWITWVPILVVGILSKAGAVTVATGAFYGDICYVMLQTSTFSDSIVYAFRNEIYRKALAKRKIQRNFINNFH